MVEMIVSGVSLDPQSRLPVILLNEAGGGTSLPLLVGPMEAMAVTLTLNGENLPRPMPHDLLLMVVRALKARVLAAEIVDLKEGLFYAMLVLRTPDNAALRVDCRPSDAVALAVRARVPIRVHERVLRLAEEDRRRAADGDDAGGIRADAVTDMMRAADARRTADRISGRLARGGGMPDDAALTPDNGYEALLRSLEPVTSRKM